MGGQVLSTEATLMQGKGRLTLTGKLGDVMQESAQAGMSYVRSRSHLFGLPKDFYRHIDIHIHVPEGAIPKDGPSAGITLCTSIVSALTRIPVRCDIAMTGEITLRGKSAADRRREGKAAGGAPPGPAHRDSPEGQRKGSGGYSAGDSGADVHPFRGVDGRGFALALEKPLPDSRAPPGRPEWSPSSARMSRRTTN